MKHSMNEKATFGKTVAMLLVSSVMAITMVACSSDSYAATTPKESVHTYTLHAIAGITHETQQVHDHVSLVVPGFSIEKDCTDALAEWQTALIEKRNHAFDNGSGLVTGGTISFTGFCSKVKSFVFLKP